MNSLKSGNAECRNAITVFAQNWVTASVTFRLLVPKYTQVWLPRFLNVPRGPVRSRELRLSVPGASSLSSLIQFQFLLMSSEIAQAEVSRKSPETLEIAR